MKRVGWRAFTPLPDTGQYLLLATGLCLLAAGCHRSEPTVTASAATATVSNPDAEATPSPERDFVNQVKSLPDDQRQAYLAQHPDLMQRVLDGNDPALASQLSDLVPPPGANAKVGPAARIEVK